MNFTTLDAVSGGAAGALGTNPRTGATGAAAGALGANPRSGATGAAAGALAQPCAEPPESAVVAELGNLIASLGTLGSQAQGLPLSPPTLPGLPQSPGYQPQSTDYTQFCDDNG